MMNQLVSVVVPCYNQAQYLSEALESVLQQTFTNWECIIVNDGSPDNTDEIAEKWINKDERFKYIEIKNAGVSNARNIGIESARGVFILPLDADDKISSDYIELAAEEFKKNKSLKVVYCKAEKFGDVTELWNLKHFSLLCLAQANMIFCTALFKKSDWRKAGAYDINMIDGLEDWEFWIAMLKDGGEVKQIDKVCFYYRIKKSSRNTGVIKNSKIELYDYICIKHSEFIIKQIGNSILLNREILKLNYKIENKNILNRILNVFKK